MNTYITRNPQVGSLVSACPQKDLLERKRLLLKLMAMRDAVRVICGPSLFGKTVLALQYAKIVFTDQSTLWVRADDLRFLRDLDSSSVTDAFSSVFKEGPACELLVFDNVPNLSFNHFRNFMQLISSLKSLGCEVIITTRHCSLFLSQFLPQNTETYKVSRMSSCDVSCGDESCNQPKPYELIGAEDNKFESRLQSKQEGSKERKNCDKCVSKSNLGQDSSRVGETETSDAGFEHGAASNARLEADHEGDHEKNHKANQKKDHEANHERDYEIDQKSVNLTFSFITAQDLLLNSREIAHVFPNETSSLLGWVRPAVLCDKKEGHKRFFIYLQHMEIRSLEDSVLLLALILGKGPQAVLASFIKEFATLNKQAFALHYPHAGFRNRGFVAFELSAEERFSLLWTHMGKLIELSVYFSELEFVEALLVELLKTEDYALIQLVLKFCLTEEERARFYKKYHVTAKALEQYKEEQSETYNLEQDHPQECYLQKHQHGKPEYSCGKRQSVSFAPNRYGEFLIDQNQYDCTHSYRDHMRSYQDKIKQIKDEQIKFLQTDIVLNEIASKRGELKGELSARREEPMARLNEGPQDRFNETWFKASALPYEMSEKPAVSEKPAARERPMTPEELTASEKLEAPEELEIREKLEKSEKLERLKKSEGSETREASESYQGEPATLPSSLRAYLETSNGNSDRLEINLFGRFEMKRGKQLIPEKGEIRKLAKIMIALLVINSQKDLPRTWIEKAVWPDNYTSTVTSNFYNLWSYIKRTLSANEEERRLLGRTRDSISLRELHILSDVHMVNLLCNEFSLTHEVEDCVRILTHLERVYQGPLLPGVDNAQLESYRNKFQNKVLDVLVEGSRIIYAKGNCYVALHFAEFAFAQDITREDVCHTYMLIQKELGYYTGAINTFLECRGALVEEYGIDAPRRLDALYAEIIKEVS